MLRPVTVLVPLTACLAAAACSATEAGPAPAAPAASSSAAPSSAASSSAAPSSASPPAAPATAGAPASGSIVLTGAVKGTMTVAVCHDGMAQLVLRVDGQEKTYNGLIDADDFTFVGPGSTGYTLADGTSKPEVSGSTYTVRGTELVSITSDDTVTADGSVTCPS